MTRDRLYVDADDFANWNAGDGVLERIHEANPAFRITLFAIPASCPEGFLAHWLSVPWVRLVAHGWRHESNYEAKDWTFQQASRIFDKCEALGFAPGWKSPGWQSSAGVFHALRARGWWLAGQHYDDERHPEGLRVYYPGDPGARHYHIGGESPNNLALHEAALAGLTEVEYGFLGDE